MSIDDLQPALLDFYYYKKGWKTLNLDSMSMQDGTIMDRLLHDDEANQSALISSIEDKISQHESAFE